MPVPYTFGTATASIPLSQLDSNFATAITIGNTAVQLGNTVTTLNNMTLANVTISSGNVTITNVSVTTANVSGTANVSTMVIIGNESVGGNTTVTGNISANNATLTTNLTLSGGTANGVAYLNTSKALTTGTGFVFDGTNVGIGTSSPNAKLQVATDIKIESATQGALRFGVAGTSTYAKVEYDDTTGNFNLNNPRTFPIRFLTSDTERMRIDSSGNVGIGTASPANGRLDVVTSSGAAYVNIRRNSQATGEVGLTLYGGTSSNNWSMYMPTSSNDIRFNTAGVDRLTINSTGNVGIGLTSYSLPLSVVADANGQNIQINGRTGDDFGQIFFRNFGGANNIARIASDNSAGLIFGTGSQTAPTVPSERMRIDSNGKLLLGVTSGTGLSNGDFAMGNGKSIRFRNAADSAYISAFEFNTSNGLDIGKNGSLSTITFGISGIGEASRFDTTGNLQMEAGAVMPYAPAPASISTTATLTNANIQAQIINTTGTTYTVTMPLGTTLETLATWATTNVAYDFFVINTATGIITMAVNTGVTSLGLLTIAAATSAHFRIRRTAANTFVLYRLV